MRKKYQKRESKSKNYDKIITPKEIKNSHLTIASLKLTQNWSYVQWQ